MKPLTADDGAAATSADAFAHSPASTSGAAASTSTIEVWLLLSVLNKYSVVYAKLMYFSFVVHLCTYASYVYLYFLLSVVI